MTTSRVRRIGWVVLIAGLAVGLGVYFISRYDRARRMSETARRLRDIGEQMKQYGELERRSPFPRTTYFVAPTTAPATTRTDGP